MDNNKKSKNSKSSKLVITAGLTCTACETRIENKLKKVQGIEEVEVSYVTSMVTVTYDTEKVTLQEIIQIIEKMEYSVEKEGMETRNGVENNSKSYIMIMGIIIFGGYLIIKNTIGFNFIPEVNANMGYGILFVVGLLTSFHCVAMCGGINLSLCVSYQFDPSDNSILSKIKPSIMYNAGRIVAYTLIGGIVGTLGSVFSISNTGRAFISIVAGVFMLIMGLNMLNIFPWLRKINPHMPKIFAKKIHSSKKNKGPFVVGILNGLMPCGPLQAMQLYALGTGSFFAGALSMFMFSLGTVPLMFAFGAIGSMLSSKFTMNMIKVSAMLVMVLGFIMVNRGLAFTGVTFSPDSPSKSDTIENTATTNEEIQEITTTLEGGRYAPITVQEGIPVEWTIIADPGNLNGCNNEIIIPEYGIKQKLVAGENVITFTPKDTGKFGYSCWMGMIRSSITVIPSNEAESELEDTGEVDNSGLPDDCCGL